MRWLLFVVTLAGSLHVAAPARAGMPAPLPTEWTAESTPSWERRQLPSGSAPRRWQAISFFLMTLAVTGYAVKFLWNGLARDVPSLPRLSTGSAFRVMVLGGLAFLIVLVMISGARELMTPGAWKKQGWTYRLAPSPADPAADARSSRKAAMETLRSRAWQHAALGGGELPAMEQLGSAGELPGFPGLHYITTANRRVETEGRLYAYEPEFVDGPRFVLLTNGELVEMGTPELRAAVAADHSARSRESVAAGPAEGSHE